MQKDCQSGPPENQDAAADPATGSSLESVTVCVVFDYKQDKWSHSFQVAKGSRVLDLKQTMVDPASPQDDHISFDLCKQRLRLSNLDTIDADETLEFRYLGLQEGARLWRRDEDVRAREEEAARLSREQERQRQEAERRRREDMARQREEEEQRRSKGQEVLGAERPMEADGKASSAAAPPKTPPEPPAATAPPQPPQAAKQEQELPLGWVWTQRGVDAVRQVEGSYGHPKAGAAFTQEHLRRVRADNPALDYISLSQMGFISYGRPAATSTPAPPEEAPAKQEQKSTLCVVTDREMRQSVRLLMPPGQTILDLKKELCSQIKRGPVAKLTLTFKTGKLLGDMAKLDGLVAQDRESLVASGLELGPPVLTECRIFHPSKSASGASVTVEVMDTATFSDLKRALCEKFGVKTTEVRLVTKKPGASAFTGCKDTDRIQGLREVGAVGKLMDRVAAGDIHPVGSSSPAAAPNGDDGA